MANFFVLVNKNLLSDHADRCLPFFLQQQISAFKMAIPLLMSCGQEVHGRETTGRRTRQVYPTSPTVEDMIAETGEDPVETPKFNWKSQLRQRGLFFKKGVQRWSKIHIQEINSTPCSSWMKKNYNPKAAAVNGCWAIWPGLRRAQPRCFSTGP